MRCAEINNFSLLGGGSNCSSQSKQKSNNSNSENIALVQQSYVKILNSILVFFTEQVQNQEQNLQQILQLCQIAFMLSLVIFNFYVNDLKICIDQDEKSKIRSLTDEISINLNNNSYLTLINLVEYKIEFIGIIQLLLPITIAEKFELRDNFLSGLLNFLTLRPPGQLINSLKHQNIQLFELNNKNGTFKDEKFKRKKLEIVYYIYTLKKRVIDALEKQESVQSICNIIREIFIDLVQKNQNWEVHLAWIQMSKELILYKTLINFQDFKLYLQNKINTKNEQKLWETLIEREWLLPINKEKNICAINNKFNDPNNEVDIEQSFNQNFSYIINNDYQENIKQEQFYEVQRNLLINKLTADEKLLFAYEFDFSVDKLISIANIINREIKEDEEEPEFINNNYQKLLDQQYLNVSQILLQYLDLYQIAKTNDYLDYMEMNKILNPEYKSSEQLDRMKKLFEEELQIKIEKGSDQTININQNDYILEQKQSNLKFKFSRKSCESDQQYLKADVNYQNNQSQISVKRNSATSYSQQNKINRNQSNNSNNANNEKKRVSFADKLPTKLNSQRYFSPQKQQILQATNNILNQNLDSYQITNSQQLQSQNNDNNNYNSNNNQLIEEKESENKNSDKLNDINKINNQSNDNNNKLVKNQINQNENQQKINNNKNNQGNQGKIIGENRNSILSQSVQFSSSRNSINGFNLENIGKIMGSEKMGRQQQKSQFFQPFSTISHQSQYEEQYLIAEAQEQIEIFYQKFEKFISQLENIERKLNETTQKSAKYKKISILNDLKNRFVQVIMQIVILKNYQIQIENNQDVFDCILQNQKQFSADLAKSTNKLEKIYRKSIQDRKFIEDENNDLDNIFKIQHFEISGKKNNNNQNINIEDKNDGQFNKIAKIGELQNDDEEDQQNIEDPNNEEISNNYDINSQKNDGQNMKELLNIAQLLQELQFPCRTERFNNFLDKILIKIQDSLNSTQIDIILESIKQVTEIDSLQILEIPRNEIQNQVSIFEQVKINFMDDLTIFIDVINDFQPLYNQFFNERQENDISQNNGNNQYILKLQDKLFVLFFELDKLLILIKQISEQLIKALNNLQIEFKVAKQIKERIHNLQFRNLDLDNNQAQNIEVEFKDFIQELKSNIKKQFLQFYNVYLSELTQNINQYMYDDIEVFYNYYKELKEENNIFYHQKQFEDEYQNQQDLQIEKSSNNSNKKEIFHDYALKEKQSNNLEEEKVNELENNLQKIGSNFVYFKLKVNVYQEKLRQQLLDFKQNFMVMHQMKSNVEVAQILQMNNENQQKSQELFQNQINSDGNKIHESQQIDEKSENNNKKSEEKYQDGEEFPEKQISEHFFNGYNEAYMAIQKSIHHKQLGQSIKDESFDIYGLQNKQGIGYVLQKFFQDVNYIDISEDFQNFIGEFYIQIESLIKHLILNKKKQNIKGQLYSQKFVSKFSIIKETLENLLNEKALQKLESGQSQQQNLNKIDSQKKQKSQEQLSFSQFSEDEEESDFDSDNYFNDENMNNYEKGPQWRKVKLKNRFKYLGLKN
ncbi:hypothetical protein PPERSA_10301 [Pseudocohnilembus persalinus]|uniref:Uncharacterized protein n=1 Tax=Pseudocohnilembus persalinus TaxID=266149 RepID=A0A0V0R047_PSEPJ|nr:hypothetical protein PPERSA_10301 [Pseudocohnilembus persalinus]|eukprot:KRX07913.1 hypothetical protein PPERSA_10301 [Pseudocohnilembus persalinus]